MPGPARPQEPPQAAPVSGTDRAAAGREKGPDVVNVAFAWIGSGHDTATRSTGSSALFVYRGQDGLLELELCKPFKKNRAVDHLSGGCASLVAWVQGSRSGDQVAFDEIREQLQHLDDTQEWTAVLEAPGQNGPSVRFHRLPPDQVALRKDDLEAEGPAPYGVGAENRRFGQGLSRENKPDVEVHWSIRADQPRLNRSVHLLGHVVLFEPSGGALSAAERMDATILQLIRLLRSGTSVTATEPIEVAASGLENVCQDLAGLLDPLESISLLSTEGRQKRNALAHQVVERLERNPVLPHSLKEPLENASLRPATISLSVPPDFAPVEKQSERLTLEPCSSRVLELEQEYDELDIRLFEDSSQPPGLLLQLTRKGSSNPVPVELRVDDDGSTVRISLDPSTNEFLRLLRRLRSWMGSHRRLVVVLAASVLLLGGLLVWFARSRRVSPGVSESENERAGGEGVPEAPPRPDAGYQDFGASLEGPAADGRKASVWTSIYGKLSLAERREQRRRIEKARSRYLLDLQRPDGSSDVLDSRKLLQTVRTGPLSEVMHGDGSVWRKVIDYPDFGTLNPAEESNVLSELQRVVEQENLVDPGRDPVGIVPGSSSNPPANNVAANTDELRSAYPDILPDSDADPGEFLFDEGDWSHETIDAIVGSFQFLDTPGSVLRAFLSQGEATKLEAFYRKGRGLRAAQRAASKGFNRALCSPHLTRELERLAVELPVPVPTGRTDLAALNRHLVEVVLRDRHQVQLKRCPQAEARVEALRGKAGQAGWLRRLKAKEIRRLLIRIRTGTDPMSARLRALIERGPNRDVLDLPPPATPDRDCVLKIVDRLNAFIADEVALPEFTREVILRTTTRELLQVHDELSPPRRIELGRYLVEDLCRGAIRSLRQQEELPALPESEDPGIDWVDLQEGTSSPSTVPEKVPPAPDLGEPELEDLRQNDLRLEVSTLRLDLDTARQELRTAKQERDEAREGLQAATSRTTSLEDENRTLTAQVERLKRDLADRNDALAAGKRTVSSMITAFGIQQADPASDPVDAVRSRLAQLTDLAVRNHERVRRLLSRAGLERALDSSRSQIEVVLTNGVERLDELECLEEIRAVAPELLQLPGLLGEINDELRQLAQQPGGHQTLLGGTQAAPGEVAERFAAAVAVIGEYWRRALDERVGANGRETAELVRELRIELLRSIDQSAVWKAFTSIFRLGQIAEVYCQPSREPEATEFYRATDRLRRSIVALRYNLDRLGLELAPLKLFEAPPSGWEFEPHPGGPPLIWGSPKLKKVSLDLYRSRQDEDLYDAVADVTTWGFRCPDFPGLEKGIIGYKAATWRRE